MEVSKDILANENSSKGPGNGESTGNNDDESQVSEISETMSSVTLVGNGSLKSLNLDIPSSYEVEPVDFPSSPAALRKVYAESMPVESNGRFDEEEEDISVYQAQLLSNNVDVRLVRDSKKSDGKKVIALSMDDAQDHLKTEEGLVSDLESATDIDLDSLSGVYDWEDSIPNEPELIPEWTAREEAAETRAWRAFNLAGVDRNIDLKVLEPYKRVISHGGYLTEGSRNAIIVFSACYLPDRSRIDYDYVMDNLFMYVISTLDQLVTDEYVLVYLHGATGRNSLPKFRWIHQCYVMIDRKLRKNLKALYLVHPTFWLRALVRMIKPFVSSKFSRKLFIVQSLSELEKILPLEQASIPEKVVKFDLIKQHFPHLLR